MTFVNQFNSKADILMEKLRTKADGKTVVTLLEEFNRVALDAIAQVDLKEIYFILIYIFLILKTNFLRLLLV